MIVSDSSPLIALARIRSLGILPALFSQVAIPDAVWREVVVQGRGKPGAAEVAAAAWIVRQSLKGRLPDLDAELEAGEREAIALAVEIGSELVLVDEGPAREQAKRQGLVVGGTLEVLLEAQRKGVIPDAEPAIRALQEAGFYMSPAVEEAARVTAQKLRHSGVSP